MIFQVDRVREAFKEHGEIATYRPGELPDDQEFWIRPSRTGKKIGEADLYKAVRVSEVDLAPFNIAQENLGSGFSTASRWIVEVQDMYEGSVPSGWILYLDARWME